MKYYLPKLITNNLLIFKYIGIVSFIGFIVTILQPKQYIQDDFTCTYCLYGDGSHKCMTEGCRLSQW